MSSSQPLQLCEDQRGKLIEGLLISFTPGLEQAGQFVWRTCGHREAECNFESKQTRLTGHRLNLEQFFLRDDSSPGFFPPEQGMFTHELLRNGLLIRKKERTMRQRLMVYLLALSL